MYVMIPLASSLCRIPGLLSLLLLFHCGLSTAMGGPLSLTESDRVALVGNGLGSRMMLFGHGETEWQRRHPALKLVIRNFCDEGNTPGFRPHSGRPSPWAFPGAEMFHPRLSEAKDRWGSGHRGLGDFPTPDAWLSRFGADVIVAFFGFNESFNGPAGLDSFKGELEAFIAHTAGQRYNGESAPRLALVSPIAFEDLSETHGTPDGKVANANLAVYTAAMEEIAERHSLPFVNLFALTQSWYDADPEPLTRDGALLTERGYARLAPVLADALFGPGSTEGDSSKVLAAVREKNWMWHRYYKIPNGVHVYGRRHRPFGPDNYPDELKKLEQLTQIRERAIWAALEGKAFDLAAEDSKTHRLPEIETNYRPGGKNGEPAYLYGEEALATMTVAEGYAIDLFASEREFPHLANPVQMSFDNRGRLWVAVMPSYPHYKPGDSKPDDKLLILEDRDGDGKADHEIVFADGLHLPTGFELTAGGGVYVAQGTHLVRLQDTDGDDRADRRETVLSGFDDHDTHHVISAFCADPSGALYMGEGTFLHSNVETAYGPVRSSNGGFFRYQPGRHHLERSARLSIPNPWGTAFDAWGQPFFLDTSDPSMRWMLPGTVKVSYGNFAPNPPNLIEDRHRVRPTSGLEFISSRHFPEDVQGDILLHNTIGFLGTKQHVLEEDGTGYRSRHRQDLLVSSDPNFRPVDLEFAPDGSLYLLDWHNVLVGHMQHSARDPLRDHVHGRVYRITYPSRPLVEPARIHGASIPELLELLEAPEDRTRYRVRRELRGRPADEVLRHLREWMARLDPRAEDTRASHEHALTEALWVTWGLQRVDAALLRTLLKAEDPRARAAAVRVLRYEGETVADREELLEQAARDPHGRVRMEAMIAASWLPPEKGLPLVRVAGEQPMDDWLTPVYETAMAHLQGMALPTAALEPPETTLTGEARERFLEGAEIYRREGHCVTCHQDDGNGLPAAQFPPLRETRWVQGDPERLIKLTLHGLLGPIEVRGVKYAGQVPMTPFKALTDEEVASVLTYVRNAFENEASPIRPEQVRSVREATVDRAGFYSPAELLESPSR